MSIKKLVGNEIEIVDLVDEDDKVIGQMPKEEVHSGVKILHREIGVLIYDKNQKVLLQQRSFKKKFYAGGWTSTAVGHVPAGKTPKEAAHMELQEELGFDAKLVFVEKRKYFSGNHESFGSLFIGQFPENATIKIDKSEVEQAKFVSHSEFLVMKKDGLIDKHTLETLEKFFHGTFTNLLKQD